MNVEEQVPPWEFDEPLCAEIGPDLYYLEEIDGRLQAPYTEYLMAKALCMQCKHLVDCREWGIENEQHGMWGGLSASERRKVKSARLSAETLRKSA